MVDVRDRRRGPHTAGRRSRLLLLSAVLSGVLVAAGLATVGPAPSAVAAPCDAPVTSPVACENSKPGNPESEWGITGSGSDTIQGFATQMSVNVGETEGFKIDTPATAYRLDVYRMGYYAGLGARKVATVNPTTIVRNQPACLSDATTGLVDCGNWTQNASWTVPADAVSGIYFAKLVRTDGTAGASHVFFVVRNDSSASQLLVQTSDTTWQAYNQYGGNSLYTGSPDGRAYKVSYNRPFTTRGTGPEDFVFNAEYPMVRWLESNGYDASYTSGADTDRRGAELLEHRVFLSVGHDEYWSGQQRANVEAARAAGVNLAFFSGNEIFWKTRWENSIDGSGTPYRTLVSYKETHANKVIDPQDPPTWTGTWRDPRFSPPADGGRPENALSGTIFTANCCAINMTVGQADGQMRFWRNTRVASLGAGATTTIGSDVIGYEWDEDADNGSRPAGLIRLSQTTGSAQVLQDYGSTYGNGTATHSMTLYRAPSGALVFGAGTVQWSWALDANHDRGSGAADQAAQQATVNLLADMGVQPTTLQAGLTAATASTDATAPTSTITAPAGGATVPVGSPVTVTGTATDAGGGRVGGVEVSADGGTTWHRATGRASWTYTFTPSSSATLTIRSRATDDSGNIESPKAGITVTAGSGGSGGSTCPCSIWSASATPAGTDPDTSAVELGVKFRASQDGFVTGIRYYKPSVSTGTHVGTLWSGTGTKLASVTFTNESASGWQQASFATPVAVTANTTYVASYFTPSRYVVSSGYFASAATTSGPLTALRDGTDGGNGVYRYGSAAGSFPTGTYNSENYWVDVVFTTGSAGPDTTKPTVTSRNPAVGATGVSTGVAPSVVFSEPVTASSVTFGLKNAAGTAVAGSTAYASGSQTATFTPSVALAAGATYTATVSGAADSSGNVMDPVTWSFTTAAASGSGCPCSIWSASATPAGTDPDTSAVELGVKFRASQDGFVTGIRYYKPSVSTGTHVGTLWSGTGTKLASVTFTNESASGWQQASFATPVAVTANTTYVASYFTPSRYVVSSGYFASAATTSGPLTALRDGTDGGNGVYRYGSAAGSFPTGSYNSENYWVDVVFTTGSAGPDTTKPTVTSRNPAVGATGVSTGVAPSVVFSEPVTASSVTFGLRNAAGTAVAGSTAYASGSQTATFTPSAALAAGATYTATVSGAADSSGNVMDPVTWSFTTAAADTTKPTVTSRNPAVGATGVSTGVAPSVVFSEPVTASSVTFGLKNAAGTAVAGSTAYASGSQTATFTPSAALAAGATYTATVSGAADSSGNVMDPVTWSFTTAAASGSGCPCSIWSASATPAGTDPDTSAVELGVKFRASQDGFVTGIRYYKPSVSTGTHVGTLWSGTGTKLASVTFTNESASGWQQASFATPVAVTANTTYVASYFTPSRYVVSSGYFASAATTSGPLTALRDGTDGGNGVYRYGSAAGSFPTGSYNSENYWVDVVFTDSVGPDTKAPTLVSRSPAVDATGVPLTTAVTATYDEALRSGSATVELRDPAGTLVAGATTYDTNGTRVVFTPSAALKASTVYSVRVSGAADAAGNVAAAATWSFTTASSTTPPPGPATGGSIAVVTGSGNPVTTYLTEIMRAEGLDEFSTIGTADLTATTLASYGVVVLGELPVTDAQVTALTSWVGSGGDLVLMRPDSRLLPLAGLTAQSGTVSNGYLAVNGSTEAGAGITTDTMQFHGPANRYALAGATSVAGLYSTATASTGQPAVTLHSVGTNGGQVAVFAYDLARSVVQTHQGNPAWAGQERDGQSPIRSDDQFFGGASADWVNLDKVAIPQADEQQRLLANLITVMSRERMPVPRFWYFPDTTKAVIVATGDDHGTGGTAGRFDTYNANSPAGCSVALWQCLRFTSFVYTSTPLTNAQASSYNNQGFEVGLHPSTNCANWTSLAGFQSDLSSQLAAWRQKYSSLPSPVSSRTHCIVWSDWSSAPKAELANGIRLDTNYYYWPGSWITDRPGFMTGSGIPMRFTDTDGSLIDAYQTNTAMTDESEQSYPYTPDALLDRALGPLGYYGAFTANMHTDQATTFEDTQLVASAKAHGVPVISARQLLTWTDGRNASSFGDLSWSGQTMSFSMTVGSGASRLTAMLPTTGPGGSALSAVARGGTAVAFTRTTVKGQEYAMFPAATGSWTATYAGTAAAVAPSTARTTAARTTAGSTTTARSTASRSARAAAPVVSGVEARSLPDGTARVTWRTSEPADSHVVFGSFPALPASSRQDDDLVRRHEVVLTGLDASATYWLSVTSMDGSGASGSSGWSQLTTRRAGVAQQTSEQFRTGSASGDLTVGDAGFGTLSLPQGGRGGFVSDVLDAQQKVDWLNAVVESSSTPAGATTSLSIRTGDTAEPGPSWTGWTPVTPGTAFDSPGRYLQFRVELSAPQGTAYDVTAVGFTHDGTLPPRILEGQ